MPTIMEQTLIVPKVFGYIFSLTNNKIGYFKRMYSSVPEDLLPNIEYIDCFIYELILV